MKVRVDLQSRPKGDLIEVPYLGLFPNGEETEVPEEQVATYEAITGESAKDMTVTDQREDPLQSMSKQQLTDLATERGIVIPSGATKADIAELLKGGQ